MQITLPENVNKIIETLENQGYEGYAVGGCVRDSILGRTPDDWDITTSAKPEEVKRLFQRTVDTGIQHGTITVLLDEENYEVTTYRVDGEYEDGRHPKDVTFTGSLIEDLKRRDFTINAMAYNEEKGLIDAFHGIQDLEHKIIRCVGDAKERFEEDALRMLRAVRFSAQLGFVIEKKTAEGIGLLAENLKQISAERIQVEMVKLLISSHPEYLRFAFELGITRVILPEFDAIMETPQNNPHHMYGVGEHTLTALEHVPPEKVLRLAVLFHDFGKPEVHSRNKEGIDKFLNHAEAGAKIAERILRRLKFDKDTIKNVVKLVKYHGLRPALTEKSVRKMIYTIGEELFPQLLEVQRADAMTKSPQTRGRCLQMLEEIASIQRGILEREECLSLKELAVNGADLIESGMKPGKEMGRVLETLLQHVLEEPKHNTKEYLIEYSKTIC